MPNPLSDLDYAVVSDSAQGIVGAFQTRDMAVLFLARLSGVVGTGEFSVVSVSEITE